MGKSYVIFIYFFEKSILYMNVVYVYVFIIWNNIDMWWDRYLFMVDLNRLFLIFVDYMWIKSSGRLIGKCN